MSPQATGLGLLWGLVVTVGGCRSASVPAPRQVMLQQSWELEPGDVVGGYLVTASLGDISIYLKGHRLRAPFSGDIEPAAAGVNCIYFSTPEIPAYLFRFCGLRRPHLGPITLGEVMGSGEYVHFATLRRQPDGTWAIVEPSSNVLERALQSR
ncbi:MAG: hypothetical protein ICV77_00795 [Cyanobacteria bacterium Co-bin8]|nr:hypothetical protein [Cyanobacteria bacterium Co-bin8]MBD2259195.1 hypothetical protein [Pseudanabaena sp. FACHB-2040]